MVPPDGRVVLNADDPWFNELRGRTRANIVTVGIENFADIRAIMVGMGYAMMSTAAAGGIADARGVAAALALDEGEEAVVLAAGGWVGTSTADEAPPSGAFPAVPDSTPTRTGRARKRAITAGEGSNPTSFNGRPMKENESVVLKDGEELRGVIEWYDKNCLKINRDDGPNLLVYKPAIKYMYKA